MSTIHSSGSGTAVATAGAATLANRFGAVTTEALTTAQNGIYTLTITNSAVSAGDLAFASVRNGTNSAGTPMIGAVTASAGSLVVEVINKAAGATALNGTLVVSFAVLGA